MPEPEFIDAEARPLAVREEPTTLAEQVAPHALAMLDANTPEEYMDRIGRVCKILVDVVEKQGLAKKLGRGDKKHVELEAWQFLASMPWIRCSAVIDWTKDLGEGRGWEARAVVYRDGQIVGAGEGMCLKTEPNWRSKDYFSLRSMAQTRALSRALQGPLRFIFVMAGYAGAGAEEMPSDAATEAAKPAPPPKAAPAESEAQLEKRRQDGIRNIHIWCAKNGIDTKGTDGLYRFVLRDTFPEVFHDAPDDEVSSKKLDLPQLQRFSIALQNFVARVKAREAGEAG